MRGTARKTQDETGKGREGEQASEESQSCKVQSGEKGKIENLVMSQKADKILE